jgi:hypothetical protein
MLGDNLKMHYKLGGTVLAIFVSMLFLLAGCSTHMIPAPGTAAGASHPFMRLAMDQDGQVYPTTNGMPAAHSGNSSKYRPGSDQYLLLATNWPQLDYDSKAAAAAATENIARQMTKADAVFFLCRNRQGEILRQIHG